MSEDDFGLGLKVHEDAYRELEKERDEWKAKFIKQNKDLRCEMMDPSGTIWDYASGLQRENVQLKRVLALMRVTEQRDRPVVSDIQKTIQVLRDFNLWRRADEDMDQPDPREIGEAIDEAIEAMEKLGILTDTAQAVVDRWETPFWKEVEHTGVYIAALRKAVEEAKGGQA
jgi:hypothetical protein